MDHTWTDWLPACGAGLGVKKDKWECTCYCWAVEYLETRYHEETAGCVGLLPMTVSQQSAACTSDMCLTHLFMQLLAGLLSLASLSSLT